MISQQQATVPSGNPRQLLDSYPQLRSRSVEEVCEHVGRDLSPHRLDLHGGKRNFEARHNRVALQDVTLNVLSYGSEVTIDPGERGDFYLVQLPLRGHARLSCGGPDVLIDTDTLAVLQPNMPTRMLWSGDCSMLLLQVPRAVLDQRMRAGADTTTTGISPRFALTQSRRNPAIGAWWQAAMDLTHNLDRFGPYWLCHPSACSSMEEFLLQALASILEPSQATAAADNNSALAGLPATQARCVKRAVEFMHEHAHECLCLDDIAKAACVSPRTLEVSFRRVHQQTPLGFLRMLRLDRVRDALQASASSYQPTSIIELALQHGFSHMGRFSAYYRERFGCPPSVTLRGGR
jgi:AraC-like DNA-binding protein